MRRVTKQGALLCGLLILAGCASSGVQKLEAKAADEQLAKPRRIVVKDFTAAPQNLPAESEIAKYFDARTEPVTEAEIELGKALGARVAVNLVDDLTDLGITAARAQAAGPPAESDVVVEGFFVTVNEGDQLERMLVGFGMGAAELKTLVEVYQMTGGQLKNLGFAEIEAKGGKMPGMLVPVGAGAATGNLARSLVIGGGVAAIKEVGPETIEAAAERTAAEISELIRQGYEKKGWL